MDDQHPEAQADRLTAAGAERVFTDKGQSGRKASRPAWDEMLSYLRKGDTLVVVRLDRMGRSVRNLIDVMNDFSARGIGVKILDQGIDTSTPAGRFFFHVLAALAEMEADLIRERTADGLAAARARGRQGGRRPKLTSAQAEELRRLYAEKRLTAAEIAGLFSISRTQLYQYVKQAA